ncbi:tRNA dihydrouridine synthase LALA0_S03e06876g [Lachancea lanzarotensis]|uniref:tRNA-dihydrouridine synthase n=1 Tax=Lachancea lanzarotensis TaxID=1245769 RepID=A0A0C7N0Z4_9SACH|nr:uncharacterized protein LALA0_S03e06876g [Lachancea lanzarotensis]CEP61614.1 LALA0S03e06876g1_1 [Lachancea lanzarotensis]
MTNVPPPVRALTKKNDPLYIIKSRKLTHNRSVTIAGPMVRYSKLPFRQVCRHYNADIVYTPMILAREFVRNRHARMADFSSNESDTPLIVQVGVNNTTDLLRFAEMVAPYCDGIGINCGCPIKEQIREGIGSALIYNPDLLSEMVSAVKTKYGDKLRLETKIRIHDNWDQTVELCHRLCDAGVDWITIHGRTRTTRSSVPVNLEAIKYITDKIKPRGVPVIANGDCFTMKDFQKIIDYTGVDGVMAVRGLLDNPALFASYDTCPWGALELFWHYAMEFGGLPHQLLLHHLHCMFESMKLEKHLHNELMDIKTTTQLIDWFDRNFVLKRVDEVGFSEAVEIPYKNQSKV